ncbi:MAG TPA: nuclear transport factor 2 family protein [Verrucomicrobiae bacterium]|jgi:hypothetical protein
MITLEEKSDLATKFITGLRTRDANLLRSIMLENLVWTLPGNSLISGAAEGIDAVIQRSQMIVDYGVNFNLKHILIGHTGVTLSLHNTARRGNLLFDEHLATVLDLQNGKVSAINTYLSDVEMLNQFFIPF